MRLLPFSTKSVCLMFRFARMQARSESMTSHLPPALTLGRFWSSPRPRRVGSPLPSGSLVIRSRRPLRAAHMHARRSSLTRTRMHVRRVRPVRRAEKIFRRLVRVAPDCAMTRWRNKYSAAQGPLARAILRPRRTGKCARVEGHPGKS